MKLSLSVRVGEKYTNKREAAISLDELADIAVAPATTRFACAPPKSVSIRGVRKSY
jgi:hypothetical protein